MNIENFPDNKSLSDCNKYMLLNGYASDVTFIVSDQFRCNDPREGKYFAHKYVLISRSSVFFTMFCGSMPEGGEVTVTDVHPQAFKQLLNYVYTEKADIRAETLLFILQAAKKYLIAGLIGECSRFFHKDLNTSNACVYLYQSIIFHEEEFTEKCLRLIQHNTRECLAGDSFLEVDQITLSRILDAKRLSMPEIEVLEKCILWARERCKSMKLEDNAQNIRHTLSDCIQKFRFLDCDISLFAEVIAHTSILTDSEEAIIFKKMACQTYPIPEHFELDKTNESRYKLPPYTVLSQFYLKLQNVPIFVRNSVIEVLSSDGIFINTIIFGKSNMIGHHGNYVKSVQLNNFDYPSCNVKQENEVEHLVDFEVTGTTMYLPKGSSLLTLHYYNIYADCYVVPSKELVLEDDCVTLQFRGVHNWMPVIGLKYSFFQIGK